MIVSSQSPKCFQIPWNEKQKKRKNIDKKDPLWVKKLEFLTYITDNVNNLNITVQRKEQLLTNMYNAITNLVQKLTLF